MIEEADEMVDMSEEAVESRLRRLSQLTRLCLELKEAGRQAGLWKPTQICPDPLMRLDPAPGSSGRRDR